MGYYLNDEWSGGSSAPLDQPQPPPRMTIGGVPVNTTADGVRIDDPTPPAPAPSADTAFGRSYDMVEDTLKHLRAYHDSVGEHAAEYSQDGLAMQLKRFGETPEARALDEAEAMADQRVAELAEEAEQARRDLAKEPDPFSPHASGAVISGSGTTRPAPSWWVRSRSPSRRPRQRSWAF